MKYSHQRSTWRSDRKRLVLAALTFWWGCFFVGDASAERILIIGDSWAEPIGIQLESVLEDEGRTDIDVTTTPFWGGPRNLDTPEGRAAISGWLNQWPDARHIYMQMGQNNWLCCWFKSMIGTSEETELFLSIIEHMDNVVEYILSIRPNATMWWTAGEYFRPHTRGTPHQLNNNHDRLADMADQLATAHPELHFIHWNGLLQVHFGFDGIEVSEYDPVHVIPAGDPSLPDPLYPSPHQAYPADRPAHPWDHAYKVMAAAFFDAYLNPPQTAQLIEMNAGLNGNWWSGPDRNGEGVQIEISDGGDGGEIFVATIYSYDNEGKQIFLIAVGNVIGATVEVNVFITDGGVWGVGFDPGLVTEAQWGTGTFTAKSCDEINMVLRPNGAHQVLGFSHLTYDLTRLTTTLVSCPLSVTN
ncbi:MAG: hypothetical protein ACR2QU_12630 [Gammaproteobacteria bacterium]